MSYTKDEVIAKIIAVLKDFDGKRNPSVIMQKLGWNKDTVNDMCSLFNVSKFSEILSQIPQIQIEKNKHGTTYVQLVQNTEHTQLNAKQEERQMLETIKHHDRISALKNALSKDLCEKDEALRLALLAAIAGESIFFLGAPGCAKSMLARRIAKAFKTDGDGSVQYFETLLNQFSTPEDVFGNISLKGLNGEGESGKEEYRRLTENMLPEADIAFIDEIWKASPAILNTLLTIINERKFHNGSKVQDVPLKALLAASNELPAKNRGLEALYDRFILRLPIGFIQNEDKFFDMVEGSSSEFELSDEIKKLQISNAELEDWKTQIDAVQLSKEARAVISAIRKELTAQNETLSEEEKAAGEAFAIGDRRWKKIVRILKTSAFLNDRTEVDLMDCQLIEYCIWSTEKQQKKAREIVEKCIQQNGLDCDTAIDDINDRIEEFTAKVEKDWFEEITDSAIDTTHSITILRTQHPTKTHPGKKKFSDIAQETLQKKFDKAYYQPIVDNIRSEIKALKDKKEADAIPFKANLFANQSYNKSLTAKLDEAIQQLQDAEITLAKQHNRYFNATLNTDFSEGDVILKDGTAFSSEEIKNLTEEQKKNVIAVVCIADDKPLLLVYVKRN